MYLSAQYWLFLYISIYSAGRGQSAMRRLTSKLYIYILNSIPNDKEGSICIVWPKIGT